VERALSRSGERSVRCCLQRQPQRPLASDWAHRRTFRRAKRLPF
jgi:hypothetical protein